MLFTYYYSLREPIVIDQVFNETDSLVGESSNNTEITSTGRAVYFYTRLESFNQKVNILINFIILVLVKLINRIFILSRSIAIGCCTKNVLMHTWLH